MRTHGTAHTLWNGLGFAALLLVGCNTTGVVGESPAANTDELGDPVPPFEAAQARITRLTESQYRNSIRDLLGVSYGGDTASNENGRKSGFAAVESSVSVLSAQATGRYANAASVIAGELATRLRTEAGVDRFVPCEPTSITDEACFSMVAEQVGRRVWRRSLSAEEVDGLTGLALEAADELDDPYAGVQYQLSALLQAPSFVYRVEAGESGSNGTMRYSNLEMASRLSYFLWDSAPDEALLAAAARGDLVNDQGLSQEVERMLADERAKQGVRRFFSELFGLDGVRAAVLDKDRELFPHAGDALANSAIEETLRVVEHNVFEERGDIRDIYTTRTTFIDRTLASVYSVRAPSREGFGAYTFAEDSGRAGVLTHASLMARYSPQTRTSATVRGAFVRGRLLCTEIPDPPADVETSFPEISRASTLRERLEEHRVNPVCANCHRYTDPIGLGLENFDAVGTFRSEEGGLPIDVSGELDGAGFEDSAQLGARIHDHPDLPGCLIKHVYQVASGHFVEPTEQQQLADLYIAFASSGYRYLDLLRAITMSPGFRTLSAAE